MISLGAVVSLEAAIWFSDLRGFTQISEGLSPEQLIESLNIYFEEVVGAIYEQGGEVLKYIGDAVLAVFPVEKFDNRYQACAAALAAVNASTLRLADINSKRGEQGLPLFHHGVGLHFGAAKYGNIGSKERLDFTVIGREVNIASRIEGKCKELQQPALASGAFADYSPLPMKSLGLHELKGIAEAVPLYAAAVS
jgi:adenylate cyclase